MKVLFQRSYYLSALLALLVLVLPKISIAQGTGNSPIKLLNGHDFLTDSPSPVHSQELVFYFGDGIVDKTFPKGTALNRRLRTWSERVEKVPFGKKAALYEKIGDAHMIMGIRQSKARFANYIKKKTAWVAAGRRGNKPVFSMDLMQNKAEEAALSYRSALESSKKKTDILRLKLAICNLSLSPSEARDFASRVSKTSPQKNLALLVLGDGFLMEQQYRKAIAVYNKANRGTPPAVQAYAFYRLGRAVQGIANASSRKNALYDKVISHYQNAVRRASVDSNLAIGTYLKNQTLILASHATAGGGVSQANRYARSGFVRPLKFETYFSMARKKSRAGKPKEAVDAIKAIESDAKRHHNGYLAMMFGMKLAAGASDKQSFQRINRQMELYFLQPDGYISLFKANPKLAEKMKKQIQNGYISQLSLVAKRKKDQLPLLTFQQFWQSSKRLMDIIQDQKIKARLRRSLAGFAVKSEEFLVAGDQYYELSKLVASNPEVRRGLLAAALTYWGRFLSKEDIQRVVVRHADSIAKMKEAIDIFLKEYKGDPKSNTARYLKVQISLAGGKDISAVMKDAVTVMQAEESGGLGSSIFLKTLNNMQKKQNWAAVIQLTRSQFKFYRNAKPKEKVEIGKILDRACSFLPKKLALEKKVTEAAQIANMCSRFHHDTRQQQKYIVEALKFARQSGDVNLAFNWGLYFAKKFPKHPRFNAEISQQMDFMDEMLFVPASMKFAQIGLQDQKDNQVKKKFQLALANYLFALERREQAKNALISYFRQFGSDRNSLDLAFTMGKQFEAFGNAREAGRFYKIIKNNRAKVDQAVFMEVEARTLKLSSAKHEGWKALFEQLKSRLTPKFAYARDIVAAYYYRNFSTFAVNEAFEPLPSGVDLREVDKIKRKLYEDSLKSIKQIEQLRSPGFAQLAHQRAASLYEAYAKKIKKADSKSIFAKNMSLTMLDRAKDHKRKADRFAREEGGFVGALIMPGPERIPPSRVVPRTVFVGFPNSVLGEL